MFDYMTAKEAAEKWGISQRRVQILCVEGRNRDFIPYCCRKVAHTPVSFAGIIETMYKIGYSYYDELVLLLEESMTKGNAEKIIKQINTAFHLENVLSRIIYTKGNTLRRQTQLQKALINFLNVLIDNGSSVAFQLRETIISPIY